MVRYKMGVGINDQQTNRTEWSASLAGSSDATIAVMGISALIEGEEGAARQGYAARVDPCSSSEATAAFHHLAPCCPTIRALPGALGHC